MCSQGTTTPEIVPPTPVPSSSGPKRTKKSAREARKHNPTKSAKKKAGPEIEDWNPTLVRFREKFDTLFSVQDGRPSGGLVPETALAEIDKHLKEDLKDTVSGFFYCVLVHHFTNLSTWQQPLQDKKSGGRARPSRSAEGYLKGLLRAIRPLEPTRRTVLGVELVEEDTAAKLLSRSEYCFLFASV